MALQKAFLYSFLSTFLEERRIKFTDLHCRSESRVRLDRLLFLLLQASRAMVEVFDAKYVSLHVRVR